MIEKLMDGVMLLEREELHRANKQYPLFASNHEGAAVIREEMEEADDDMARIFTGWNALWENVKDDSDLGDSPYDIQLAALHCAAECIQVAAMAKKITMKE